MVPDRPAPSSASRPAARRPATRGRPAVGMAKGRLFRALALAGALLAACVTPSTSAARAAQPLHIGFVFGLTGPWAPEESDVMDGAKLAVEEHNAAAGPQDRPIVLTAHDTKNLPIGAKVAAEEAIFAGASLLLAPAYSSQALEAARAAQALGVPLISVIATHPDIVAVGDYIFRVCFDDHAQAKSLATFAHATLGARTAVFLVDLTSAYGLAMTSAFRERFTALGGQIVEEIPYKMQQHAFDDQLRQAARAKADALFMPGYWVDGVVMVKKLEAFGITAVPLAGDGWGSSQFETRRGDSPRHGYYTDHWAAFMTDEASKRFTQAYVQRFGRPPVAGSALAYDAVRVAAEAAKTAGSIQPDHLRQALATIRDFPGVTGRMTFNSRGETRKSVHIMEIVNGKAELVQTIDPEETP